MSLLNDALKRAQEAQRPNAPAAMASMRSVETRRKPSPRISRLLVVVIFLLLAVGVGFIGLAMMGRMAKKAGIPTQAARTEPVHAMTAPAPPVPTAPVVAKVAPVVPVAAEPTPTLAAAAPAPVAVAEPPPAVAPKPVPAVVAAAVALPPLSPLALPDTLHVQGITFDPVKPCAIVSGKTVSVGDMVKGLQVMAITRDSVTFGSNGRTNLLFVGQ